MNETYQGVKFETLFIKKEILKNKRIEKLNYWCKRFSELGFAPKIGDGSAGNLSFRTSNGFIITASNSDLRNMTNDDFVEVLDVNLKSKNIKVIGKKSPSSESMLHFLVYKNRTDINAIFHGHSKELLNSNFISTKKEKPYGTIIIAEEVLKILGKKNLILMKNHGFLSFGKTMNEAWSSIILSMKKK